MDLVRLLSAAPSWVRVAVSVLAALWASTTVVTNALRAVPEDRFVALERSLPRLGQLLRAARKFGTDVLPFVAALAGALAGLPVQRVERDARYGDDAMPPRPAPPRTIPPQAGMVRPAVLLALLVGVMLLGFASLRCTASAVETQAAAADRIARTLNAVEPRWVAESERRATAAARELCSLDAAPCDRAAAHAAADRVLDQWEPVRAAWDSFAAAHDVWRTTLEGCRARRDAVCSPGVDAATAMLRAVGTWRCAVRAVGHPEYDPLPGEPSCADGGAP